MSAPAPAAHGPSTSAGVMRGLLWIIAAMTGVAGTTIVLGAPPASGDAMLVRWLPVQVFAGVPACALGGWHARRLGAAPAVRQLMALVLALGIAEGAVLLATSDLGSQRPLVAAAPLLGALGVWVGGSLRGGLVSLRLQWLAIALAGVYATAALARPGMRIAPALKVLAILGELGVIGTIVVALWRARRPGSHAPTEPLILSEAITTRLFGSGRLAQVVATEMALLIHALRPRQAPPQPRSLQLRRGGQGAFVAGFSLVILVEAVALHLLVTSWSPLAAWLLTGLSAYGLLWLVGDYRAIRDQPSDVDGGVLHLRLGIRWRVVVPLSEISSVSRIDFTHGDHVKTLRLAPMDDPNVCIAFTRAVTAHGYYGLRKDFTSAHAAFEDPTAAVVLLAGAGTRRTGAGGGIDVPSL